MMETWKPYPDISPHEGYATYIYIVYMQHIYIYSLYTVYTVHTTAQELGGKAGLAMSARFSDEHSAPLQRAQDPHGENTAVQGGSSGENTAHDADPESVGIVKHTVPLLAVPLRCHTHTHTQL